VSAHGVHGDGGEEEEEEEEEGEAYYVDGYDDGVEWAEVEGYVVEEGADEGGGEVVVVEDVVAAVDIDAEAEAEASGDAGVAAAVAAQPAAKRQRLDSEGAAAAAAAAAVPQATAAAVASPDGAMVPYAAASSAAASAQPQPQPPQPKPPQPHHALVPLPEPMLVPRTPVAAAAAACGLRGAAAVNVLLRGCRLEQYGGAFEEQGYDDLPHLLSLGAAGLAALAASVGMKAGHLARFRDLSGVGTAAE